VNGTFVPAANGNFALTLREAFNAKTGTFVPSSTGNFLLSARGNLVSAGTKTAVGSFLPFVPPIPTTSLIPGTATNVFATNPYAPVNPYAAGMANPYAAMSYPMPYPVPSNYGSPISGYGTPTTTSSNQTTPGSDVWGAYGVPSENGHIKWPLAFRLLPAEQKQNLLDRLEGQLVLAATQASSGALNASSLSEATRSVARLSAWLTAHRTDMAEATYRDGLDFVRTLDEALAALKR
jgi:hypothetical protein